MDAKDYVHLAAMLIPTFMLLVAAAFTILTL